MEDKRVMVLGHRGMLGHMVCQYLVRQGYDVVTTSARFDGSSECTLIAEVRSAECPVVNCIGTTLLRSDPSALMISNALLPQQLALSMAEEHLLVHASTDAVFPPFAGPHLRSTEPRGVGDYSMSKRIGETCRLQKAACVVFRCSIVGPDSGPPRGLLGWFLSQKSTVQGYANHLWNGISSLAWARASESCLRGDIPGGLYHLASTDSCTKEQLLRLIGATFEHSARILTTRAPQDVDRRLVPNIECGPIESQLAEMREWVKSHQMC